MNPREYVKLRTYAPLFPFSAFPTSGLPTGTVPGSASGRSRPTVTRPQAGRQLCEAAVLKYVDRDGIKRFERAVARKRKEMRQALDRLLKVGRR